MSQRGDRASSPTDGHQVGPASWKDVARGWVGRVCVPLLPASYRSKFMDDYYIDQEPRSFFKRAVRDELTRSYYASPDAEIRALNRRSLWGGTAGVRWHEAGRRKHQGNPASMDQYLQSRGRLFEQVDWLLAHFPAFKDVCEIGTGNGLMIEHLSRRLTQVERFQGIDLSAEQIALNRVDFQGSKVEYLHVEASDHVRNHCRPGTLFVTCGTFECIAQAELEELLVVTRRAVVPVAFAICDAVNVDYDFQAERDSRPRGDLFFSHNYRHLLEKHGYEVCREAVEFPKPIYHRVSILAASFADSEIGPRHGEMADRRTEPPPTGKPAEASLL